MAEYVSCNTDEQIAATENLRLNLRKMIKTFSDYIKEVDDYQQLEENLKHMEETDENFHKYDLVEDLANKIECVLGSSIDYHVNETFTAKKFDGDIDAQNKLARTICTSIMKTGEFNDFKLAFKASVVKENENLLRNFQTNFVQENCDEILTMLNDNDKQSVAFTNDFECLSLDQSIYNQNSFVFFSSEQFPAIAQNLDAKKPDQERLKAIQQMLSIPAGDPQAADHWVKVRKQLLLCLRDPNAKVAALCLKLHSRTLASSHYKVSMEIYKTLIDHLSEFFRDKELEKRIFGKDAVEIESADNLYILKIFRLINDYAKDITSKWTRYPENFIETIVFETLKLLSISIEQKLGNYLTPVHYISLLDIQSNWFTKWMHGHDCRGILINSLSKNDCFLQISINSIYSYLSNILITKSNSTTTAPPRKKPTTTNIAPNSTRTAYNKRNSFRKTELDYAHFVHSINVIRRILCFQNGRRLFPIKVASKEISLKDLIKTIIQLVFETSHFRTPNEHSPSKHVFELLQDLCASEETCRVCLCNEEVIEQLLKPLKSIMQISKKSTGHVSSISTSSISSTSAIYDEICMHIIANVLSKLASTECGYFQLLYNNSSQNFQPSLSKNSPANIIVTFVCKALNNQLNYYLSTSEIAEYLYLARLLYSQCQGVTLIKEHELNRAISESVKLIIKETTSSYSNGNESEPNTPRLTNSNLNVTFKEMFNFSWSDSLLDNLSTMASTPKGVFYLAETGLIGKVVSYMFTRYKARLQVGRYEKFGYGFMISQLANTSSGGYHLNECGLIQHLIEEIWTELEYGNDDFMSAFPRSYSVEIIDRDVYKPMLCLFNILSSFAALFELLGDTSATPRSFYSTREIPKGLIGLLDRVAFIDKAVKISSLCNYEQSHIFGIRLLSFLQSDLDVMLLLESQYEYSKILLNLQAMNRTNPIHIKLNMDDPASQKATSYDNPIQDMDNFNASQPGKIIVDMHSVERNFVLVNANLIGGPSEKILPLRNTGINQNENFKSTSFDYTFPLFDSLPVPDYYLFKAPTRKIIQNKNEFFEMIDKHNLEAISKNEDSIQKYLISYKHCFANSILSGEVNEDLLPVCMSQFVDMLLKAEQGRLIGSSEFSSFNDFITKTASVVAEVELSGLQILGVKKTIQYGFQSRQLQKLTCEENEACLIEIMKYTRLLLKSANKNPKRSESTKSTSILNYNQEDQFPSYDWFVSTIFLVYNGEKNSTLKFLYKFHCLRLSAFLWPARLYLNETLISSAYTTQGICFQTSMTYHFIELILKIELPFVFNAFRMSGMAPSQICSHWLKQFFWNYLDWADIVLFVNICLILGVDYMAYYCVAVLKHLNERQKIVKHHTYKDLQVYLKESQIEGFSLDKYIGFMNELEKKYRTLILDDMKNSFS